MAKAEKADRKSGSGAASLRGFNGRELELSWSIFHARELELSYARQIVRAASRFEIDSLELCGSCHGRLQGMEGGIYYRRYPGMLSRAQQAEIRANIGKLRAIGQMAHKAGLPLYYWHREVCVPPEILALEPGLLDERREFDLLGSSYQRVLEGKLTEFFHNVPEIDGIVLTLTESDYSVIHNSQPDRYPAAKVVERLIRIFARAHRKAGKRLILRSFGSIEQDHCDLFAGVRAVQDETLEVETKVTPFDWSPFLPLNRWLKPLRNHRISAEMDAMGEYFGPGVLPSPCPEEMFRYLRYALDRQVGRIAVRVDRGEASALGTVQEVNLQAVSRALRSRKASPAAAWEGWESRKAGPGPLAALMRRNFEVIKLSRYIDGSLMFHTFPISPSFEYLKLGGIFALFEERVSLRRQRDMWSIRSWRKAPSAINLIREKEEAVHLARRLLQDFAEIKPSLRAAAGRQMERLLENGLEVAQLLLEFCRSIQAYFRDMRKAATAAPVFPAQIQRNLSLCRRSRNPEVVATHAGPMVTLLQSLQSEYRAERRAREKWQSLPDIADFVICGGLLHEWRTRRLLHGSGSRLADGRQERRIGNPAFPNGYLEYELEAVPGPACLIVHVDKTTADRLVLQINSAAERHVEVPGNGEVRLPIDVRTKRGTVRVRITRGGALYPWIHALAIQQKRPPAGGQPFLHRDSGKSSARLTD